MKSEAESRPLPIVRRLMATLFLGQSLASAGYIAAATVSSIVGARLSGGATLAGVPTTVYLIGGAVAAYPASRLMQRWGRRPGLALGMASGVVGALTAGGSVLLHSFGLFLAGMVLMGASNGTTNLSRFAAAEMQPAERRASALSLIVWAGTLGAVFGPLLVGPLGRLAERLQADPLAGPWLGAAVLFAAGLLVILTLLRPDPAQLARAFDQTAPAASASGAARPLTEIFRAPSAGVALISLVASQAIMIMLMAITGLHMTDHRHPLGDVSIVIAAHTLGMFGLSAVSGRLADRFGRAPTISLGALSLIAASALAPVSQSTWLIGLALFLLGWGWNLCYVSGSALITEAITPAERGPVQGTVDLVVNLTSAAGSLGSGLAFATLGYAAMGIFSAAAALVPLTFAGWLSRQTTRG